MSLNNRSTVSAGDQYSFSSIMHISPVSEIQGCQILFINFMVGGLKGYSDGASTSI